ncbi:hypothetical protein BC628DRAFT_1431819 [Trametes gibbosa]|nr:hypothetical protein BC628DRAFT_1431819 [Trametes gibbosa]
MGKEDDIIPEGYPYQWTPDAELSLQDFLSKYKPSMVQNDGTKPWLWVHKSDAAPETKCDDAAMAEAAALLSQITQRVQQIQDDASIPIRSNKKKGLKSKKELREEVQHEATAKLKEISNNHGCVSGKWLIFAPPDRVDTVWNHIANSLVSGPLASTCAYAAKVATSPQSETPNYSHLVSVYVPDVYDQPSVTEVMKVLLRSHGLNLMGAKSNLYTSIGIDSKHPSGIPSTVWKNTALMKDTEIKACPPRLGRDMQRALKEEYFNGLNTAKTVAAEETAGKKAAGGDSKKPKLKLKRKGGDNPFGSDEEDADEVEEPKPTPLAPALKGKKAAPKKKGVDDTFASDDEAEPKEKPPPKKRAMKRSKQDDEDESEAEAPKKKRVRA